jgi:hypothetical protein
MDALDPLVKFRKCKVFVHADIWEFNLLLQSTIMGVKSMGLLTH